MKFNNKLSLIDYITVIGNIVNQFFDSETSEYTPQVGEIYAVCEYYNYCVTLEDGEDDKVHPIEDIMKAEALFDNVDFMVQYNNEINGSDYFTEEVNLTFGHAYHVALDIVENKKSDANAFANAITLGLKAIFSSFTESFSNENLQKLAEIGKQIADGDITSEVIAKAYEKSSRFKNLTE